MIGGLFSATECEGERKFLVEEFPLGLGGVRTWDGDDEGVR